MLYNEKALKKIHNSTYHNDESLRSRLSDSFPRDTGNSNNLQNSSESSSLNAATRDLEMPMPPLALTSLQQHVIR